jgi:hypothetical protein
MESITSYNTIADLESLFNPVDLVRALRKSIAGQFFSWKWEEWHRKLCLIKPGDPTSPMPPRQIGPNEFVPIGHHIPVTPIKIFVQEYITI